jgi:hypothetical protein
MLGLTWDTHRSKIIIMRLFKLQLLPLFLLGISLHADEVKVRKGIVLVQPLVESRARSAYEKTTVENRIEKNESVFYSNRLLLRIATEFFERIEIYGDIGSADISAPDFDDFSSGLTLVYGGGINCKLLRSEVKGHPYAIAGLRYLQYEPVTDTVNVELIDSQTGKSTTNAVNDEITWREWEAEIGAGFRSGSLELKGGVRFSFINARDKIYTVDFEENMKLREEDNAGMFINADFYIDPEEKFAFNFGITAIDVNSLFAGVKLWF